MKERKPEEDGKTKIQVGRTLAVRVQAPEEGMTVGQFLRRKLGFSRRQVSSLKFREDGIRVNGEKQRIHVLLKRGDLLELALETGSAWADKSKVKPCPGQEKLQILYEDRDLLAVEKPAGVVCHPSHGHYLDTLANQAADYLETQGGSRIIRLAGRLDKDTSGVVLFAKNREAAAALYRERAARKMKKIYLALTENCPEPQEGIIDAPIAKIPGELMKMQADAAGKPARTRYRVLWTDGKRGCRRTLVEAVPEQGRTHQIRVHLALLGCPLEGDALYGNPEGTGARLHAWKLYLTQPFTGQELCIEASYPEWAEREEEKTVFLRRDVFDNRNSIY